MQIKIEIDVRPEELRRFLGLPDVSGLQEDIVAFLRDKLGAAGEFDASQFVKNNFDTLRRTPAWKRFASRLRAGESAEEAAAGAAAETAAARSKARPKSTRAPRKRSPRKTAAKPAAAPSSDAD
ncbi:DUF6489 family protein [Solimonas marina]|uniref:Uncharacterized protein n=1 Tax=Solimonas marina TaxID=2714601 RepID=A0A970B8F6_9GAMM|nr:DUF6489 family protein [Solimonas marina]NKF21336.1 hypothetical protein [Solimonas marina]